MRATLSTNPMKRVGKSSLLLVVALAPTRARAESVTQFAPIDEASSPATTSAPTTPEAKPQAAAPPAWAPPQVPAKADWASPPSSVAPPTPPAPAPTPSVSDATTVNASAGQAAIRPATPQARPDATPSPAERHLTLSPKTGSDIADTARSDDQTDDDHYVSLSFSVVRAVASLYEVTGEVALGRNFGLAVLGGVGSLETKHPEYDQQVHLKGKEFGAQARVYVLGGFDHGLMLGGEALRVWADVSPTQVTDPAIVTINGMRYGGTATLSGEGTLTGLAAFIGYKVIASFGLTLDAKLGWQSLTLEGTGQLSGEAPINGQNVPVSESGAIRENRGVPLFNLNLGWSI